MTRERKAKLLSIDAF